MELFEELDKALAEAERARAEAERREEGREGKEVGGPARVEEAIEALKEAGRGLRWRLSFPEPVEVDGYMRIATLEVQSLDEEELRKAEEELAKAVEEACRGRCNGYRLSWRGLPWAGLALLDVEIR